MFKFPSKIASWRFIFLRRAVEEELQGSGINRIKTKEQEKEEIFYFVDNMHFLKNSITFKQFQIEIGKLLDL